MFCHGGNHALKGATIKGKNMLPIGSIFMGNIFFPLKAAPMRKENNFKGHLIEKTPKSNYANMSVF